MVDYQESDYEPPAGCSRCGDTDCQWVWTGVRWKLVEEAGHAHVCKPSAEGFEDLTKCRPVFTLLNPTTTNFNLDSSHEMDR